MGRSSNQYIGPVSRRDFLRLSGGVVGAGLAYWTLRPKTTAVADGVLPPGALPVGDFAAACLRCGRCTAVCDQHAIEMGVDGRPFISGLNGWCDFSMDCVNVCPSGALLPFDLETVKIGTAVIDTDRCLAWNHFNACRLCVRVCDDLQQAIWVDDDMRPHIDDSRCNGCGACVFVCPRSAYEGIDKKYGKVVALRELTSDSL